MMDQNMQPAPASPMSVPGIPETPELSQDQMRANLTELMDKIQGKYGDFNAQKFASDNKVKEGQSSILRQIFDLLESAGVDPSNPDQVKAFLDKLKMQNPELATQFETALQSILGPDEEMGTEEPVDTEGAMPSDNMNINTNALPPEGI